MRYPLVAALAAITTTSLGQTARATEYSFASTSWSRVISFSFQLAGRDLNGTHLNGDSLEGRHVAWVWLDEGRIGAREIDALWLEGTRFFGVDAAGKRIKPKDVFGAELVAQLDDGSTLPLYVTDVKRHPDKHLRDVLGYEVWLETATGWEPFCGVDADGLPTLAIPLAGRWSYEEGTPGGGSHTDDPLAFTFACAGYVLAKCVTAGYKPWSRVLDCQPGQGCSFDDMSEHHQACTRALRGDYYGDGTPHTVDGTTINLYDGLGVRYDSEEWAIEAEWDAEGAICVATPRLETQQVTGLFDPDCGTTTFDDGTVLVTELSP